MDFEDRVLQTIRKYGMIQNFDKVVVAVSGGPDSMALLNSLISIKEKLKIEIIVAHVNHMIRKIADEETMYVELFCKKNNIECYTKKIDVLNIAKAEKISTEEAGRNERYKFFEDVLAKNCANKIAIAHNANDNAETVLMNIIRGTGVSGLKGIEPIRLNKFIRPLIEIERADIEEYCDLKNLNPRHDESNDENVYTRNKIRNMLIPYIKKEFNPNIVECINRLSNLAEEETLYIEKNIDESYKRIVYYEDKEKTIVLDLKQFNKEDNFIKGKLILSCIAKIFGSPKGIEKKHIEDIIKLCSNNVGNKYLMPNKHTRIYVNGGKIYISKVVDNKD